MEITNISSLDRTSFINQDYKPQDETLLNSLEINNEFGNPEDKIEIHVISPNGDVIESVYDFRNYKINSTTQNSSLFNQIELDPKSDLESFGYFSGQYDVNYNFYRQLFLSSPSNNFYISEISSDRTEIKISNNNISYTDLGQAYLNYITTRNSRNFYSDFILNFGENDTYIAVNVALDNVNTNIPSLYIKLYEPLPVNLTTKNTLWLVESISEPYSFRVNTEFIAEEVNNTIPLRGPNTNIELNDKVNLTTPYLNLSNLLTNSSTSSYQQLQSWLEEKSIEITVDYTDFNNFIHFSSAEDRLNNFKYKLTQIQSLQSDIDILNNLNPLTSSVYINNNKEILQNKLNSIIEKFDGYEYYLYYESSSKSWPKTTSTKPYINASVTSSLVLNWFGSTNETSNYYGGEILSASNYDISNRNYIWNNLPEYIKADSQNSNLELFTSMLGQHYDYIWTYIKDITDIQVADNRLDFGISKDLVADTLKNFGIKLYTNSRNQDDIYSSLLGINAEGSFLPSTGSYLIDNYVTASQYTIPDNDIVKETYKRVYHNLPYLLKTRGTRTGLNALINCFGIPETILKIKEYGGSKKGDGLIEQIIPKFNYNIENPNIIFPWNYSQKQFLDTGEYIMPDTLEFRFKLDSIVPTQSILLSDNGWRDIRITYTTGSNANIDFGLSNDNNYIYSNPIELPLYNEDWWTLNLTRETGSLNISQTGSNNTYTLTIGNKNDLGIQYLTSSSIFITGSTQRQYNRFGWNKSETLISSFSGSIQEFRYWIGSIPLSDFKDHILNPRSISFNGVTGSYNNLIYRLPLGSELDTNLGSNIPSVHPSSTSSFTTNISSSIVNGNYVDNFETYLVNTPNIGNITEIDEKVRIVSQSLITGSVLTPYISIQKPLNPSYTNDLSIVDISLSPQDSINSDIIAQLGSFNIDEYIGDPRLASSSSYPALNELRDFYFQKYSKSQNIFDLIKLLSYFDNSLFKMIKDFVPAKTNLSTGLVIKPHILERNKTARQEPILEFTQFSGSIETSFITGSNGLDTDLDTTNTITTQYLSGSINRINTDKRELFTGELGGTEILVHSQSLENVIYEHNSISLSSSQDIINNFSRLPINPILNNVIGARTSNRYLDVDYAYNPITPVNFNFLTSSLFLNLRTNLYPFLNSTVQDSNYTLYRHITPRYLGSKNISATYNTFSPGDLSYGSEAAIDYNNIKFAYFNELTSQSLTFPGRTNVNIKYLIDSSSNVIELTEANKNIFDVQNTFNKTTANLALDNINQPSKQKRINGLKPIYAGGFRYEPILQNYSLPGDTHTSLNFNLEQEISIINPASGSLITSSFNGLNINNCSLKNDITISPSLNLASSTLTAILNSGINVNITRTQAYSETIYQRITGQIQVNVSVSPTPLLSTLYSKENPPASQTGLITWNNVPLGEYQKTSLNGLNPSFNNILQSVTLPVGVKGSFYNDLNFTGASWIHNGTGVRTNTGVNEISSFILTANNTQATFTPSNQLNSFGTFPTFNTNPGGPYNIEEDNGLSIIATFQIDGFIELQPDVCNVGSSVTLPLKSLNGLEGVIRTTFTFNKTSTSSNIRFTQIPTVNLGIGGETNGQYILTDAPNRIYTTAIIDNGFNSGSTSNWYFERGKNNEGKFTQLTASYDLSTLYSKYVSSPVGEVNYFTQVLPTSSINAGYQEITEIFNPKPGDLIRFWNGDSSKYPFTSDFEREIIKIIPPQGPVGSGFFGTDSYANRLVIEVLGDDIPSIACSNKNNLPGEIGKILNFIIMSKIPDETNVIIQGEKNSGQTSGGIIIPGNINKLLKDDAGNIVKNLKSQNLI